MRIAGIVAEYNPFHNGHLHLAQRAREAGVTHIAAVMSGNYVQRGEPALLPKPLRARAAVASGGADLVLELPLPYACAAAGQFAFGAVGVLEALGVCDTLAFGCEEPDTQALGELARALGGGEFAAAAAPYLGAGESFAAAREKAAAGLLGAEKAALLRTPNNLLAVDYLIQLRKRQSVMAPLPVAREGAAHDGAEPSGRYASASALRLLLARGGECAAFLPPESAEIYARAAAGGLLSRPERMDMPMLARLRSMGEAELAALPDVSEGLEHRLAAAIAGAESVAGVLDAAKTKRYAHSRLRRILLAAYLGIEKDMSHLEPPYVRILAMNRRGMEILAAAKGSCALPVSQSLAELARQSASAGRFAAAESRATDLYYLTTGKIQPCGLDYSTPVGIIE